MRDRDQRARPLWHRLAFQIDHPVLGHDVHHVGARRRHDVAVVDSCDDPARAPSIALVGRGETYEGLAVARGVRAAYELKLSAGAAYLPHARRLGARLPPEIDLR